jgi:hypothetical protein
LKFITHLSDLERTVLQAAKRDQHHGMLKGPHGARVVLAALGGEIMAVKPCKCKHDYQDKMYGKGNRVHNFARNANNKSGGWRCSVCGDIKSK